MLSLCFPRAPYASQYNCSTRPWIRCMQNPWRQNSSFAYSPHREFRVATLCPWPSPCQCECECTRCTAPPQWPKIAAARGKAGTQSQSQAADTKLRGLNFFLWTTRWSGCTNRRSLSEKRKVITSSCKIFRSAKCAFSAVLVVTIYIFTVCRRQLRLPRVNMLWYCDSFNRHFSSSIIFTKHVDRSVNARLIFLDFDGNWQLWAITCIGKNWLISRCKSLGGCTCKQRACMALPALWKHMFWKKYLLCQKRIALKISALKNMTDVFTEQLFESGSATGHISMTLDSAKPSPVFRVGVRQGYSLVWDPLLPAISFSGSVKIVQILMLVIFELFKMSK